MVDRWQMQETHSLQYCRLDLAIGYHAWLDVQSSAFFFFFGLFPKCCISQWFPTRSPTSSRFGIFCMYLKACTDLYWPMPLLFLSISPIELGRVPENVLKPTIASKGLGWVLKHIDEPFQVANVFTCSSTPQKTMMWGGWMLAGLLPTQSSPMLLIVEMQATPPSIIPQRRVWGKFYSSFNPHS